MNVKVLNSGSVVQMNGVTYHHHKNGGGLVADTAKIPASTFVHVMAIVEDQVEIEGKVKINEGGRVGARTKIIGPLEVRHDQTIFEDTFVDGRGGKAAFTEKQRPETAAQA